jgi:hypothetical protein
MPSSLHAVSLCRTTQLERVSSLFPAHRVLWKDKRFLVMAGEVNSLAEPSDEDQFVIGIQPLGKEQLLFFLRAKLPGVLSAEIRQTPHVAAIVKTGNRERELPEANLAATKSEKGAGVGQFVNC